MLQQLRGLLQQDAQLLQRLRHPRLLQVVEPPQQGKDSWVFCTKPVVLSLRQLLETPRGSQQHQQHERDSRWGYIPPNSDVRKEGPGSNITSIGSKSSSSSSKQQQHTAREAAVAADFLKTSPYRSPSGVSLLEVKCGLVDIAEALSFLHGSAQLLHLNLHPESVFIDSECRWKLGGLFFAQQLQGKTDSVDCNFSFGYGPSSSTRTVLISCVRVCMFVRASSVSACVFVGDDAASFREELSVSCILHPSTMYSPQFPPCCILI